MPPPPTLPRPLGELLWIHAAEPGSLLPIQDLAARLCSLRYGLSVLITVPEGSAPYTGSQMQLAPAAASQTSVILQPYPGEHPDNVAQFLDHWHPDTCLWFWGALRPNLVLEAAARDCPMILLNADTKGFDGRRDRWLTDLTRQLLAKFDPVLARSASGKRRLVQLGLAASDVEVTPTLMAGGQTLNCPDRAVADLAEALGGRPVWFAAQLHATEIPVVLAAHRQAMRLSHRLLLILCPAAPQDADAAAAQAIERGFDVLRWENDRYPDDTTQVLIADDAMDRGLFYRVAPVSFLGCSLVPDQGGFDPFEAAALGSAVLYGPKVRDFMPSYTRLAAAGAARIVNDAAALGTAVSHLIAPDQAAAMAHAGWDVTSQGAELTDKVVDLVQNALDRTMARK